MAEFKNGEALAAINYGKLFGGGDKPAVPTKPIVVDDKIRTEWNKFQDFLQQNKMVGNPALDNKDTQLGKKMIDAYRQANPSTPLTYDHVAAVQNSLNNYRMNAWKLVQAGKADSDAKTIDDFMPHLSQTDGWLGSKTSQARFPAQIMDGKVVGFADNPTLQQQVQQVAPQK